MLLSAVIFEYENTIFGSDFGNTLFFSPPISIPISSHWLSFLFTLFALLFYHSVIAPFQSSSSLLPLPLFLPLSLPLFSLSLHLTLSLSPFLPPFLPSSLFLFPCLSLHFSLTPFLPPAHISFLNFPSLPPTLLLFSSHRQRRFHWPIDETDLFLYDWNRRWVQDSCR